MDKLNKLAMPDVKSGTPQEKMNAVKKALQSLEMMTEAYNQIVPVINAKIDWLSEAEMVVKDDTQDKKIDELIAVNKVLLGRIAKLESKGDYDDSEIVDRIGKLESKPDYKYDDKPIKKMIADIAKQQGEFSRSQNELDKAIKAIEIPKVPSIEPLRKRIKTLEGRPQCVYDDKILKERVTALELKPKLPAIEKYDDSILLGRLSSVEKSMDSLDKRIDFIRRSYGEKWDLVQFYKAKDDEAKREIKKIKDELGELKKSFSELIG